MKIKSKFVDNNSKVLSIVFQGTLAIEKFSDIEKRHDFFRYNEIFELKNSNILYISDFFSSSYGYYILDYGSFIIKEIQDYVTKVIKEKEYDQILLFGYEKGGFAALLYGGLLDEVNVVNAVVPNINILEKIEKSQYSKKILENFQDNHFEYVKSLLYTSIQDGRKKKFNIYTNLNNIEFELQNKIYKFLKINDYDVNFIIGNEKNDVEFLKENMKNIINDSIKKKRIIDNYFSIEKEII